MSRFSFGPTDLPELRREVCAWQGTEYGREYWAWRRDQETPRAAGEPSAIHSVTTGGDLLSADLYFVAADMAALAAHASRSIPDYTIQPEDLPSRSGFMVSAVPFFQTGDDGDGTGTPLVVDGFAWTETPGGEGVFVGFLTNRDQYIAQHASAAGDRSAQERLSRSLPRLYEPVPAGVIIYGEPEGEDRAKAAHSRQATAPALVLKSTWLLMQQTLAVFREERLNRATRRRIERKRILHTPLRVVTLRRAHTAVSDSDTSEGREYLHQWIVRGHWRQQPYGPGRSSVRPTWIAPHIKGPEGAPMLGGEKVYAWRR